MLETTAATKACEVRTEEDVARIGKILGEMRSAGANLKKYLKKNQELHFGIYAIAGFPIMLQIIDALWARIGPYFNLQVFSREHLDYFLKSHEEMFVALKNRDQAKMSQALKLDLQSAAGRLRPLLVQRSLGSGSRTRRAKGTSQ
jgi:DNA-binding GntR family transcriptional regulator